ncbi:MAG: hypothetical protein R2695_07065 [Acidimicrobiales bacterium]
MFAAMYAEVARLARTGTHVAVDVGHHDDYSVSLGILDRVRSWLADLPRWWWACAAAVLGHLRGR